MGLCRAITPVRLHGPSAVLVTSGDPNPIARRATGGGLADPTPLRFFASRLPHDAPWLRRSHLRAASSPPAWTLSLAL
jgi:hypothetical protein